MLNNSEIKSLLYLLDDPDPFVQQSVEGRLYELGEQVVPLLDEHKQDLKKEGDIERVNGIIHSITFGNLESDFYDLIERGVDDLKQLEEIIWLMTRFRDPTFRPQNYKNYLDNVALALRDEVNYTLDDRKKMRKVLRYIFHDMGYRGDIENYYHPDNSYLNSVITRKKGIPISLSLIIMFVGRRLDLPFYGINMPIHFMVNYDSGQHSLLIDAFDGGTVVTYNQCYNFLKKNGVKPKAEHFEKASPKMILTRYLRNLINSYTRNEDEERAEQLQNLLSAVK